MPNNNSFNWKSLIVSTFYCHVLIDIICTAHKKLFWCQFRCAPSQLVPYASLHRAQALPRAPPLTLQESELTLPSAKGLANISPCFLVDFTDDMSMMWYR